MMNARLFRAATVQLMREQHIEGVLDVIPAFCSLLINYDPRVISYSEITKRMKKLLKVETKAGEKRKKFLRSRFATAESMVRIWHTSQSMRV